MRRMEKSVMTPKKLDITGKTSPYCLSRVAKEAKALKQSGELFITCDNFSAAMTSIPRIAREEVLSMEIQKPSDGRWEIRLTRK
jgi:TusA-related sulfurtransferase